MMPRASLQDHVERVGLRLAKVGRRRHDEGVVAFYDGFFSSKSLDEYTHDLRHIVRRREVLDALAPLPDGALVVDLGCGVGGLLAHLPARFRRLGMDLSRTSLACARRVVAADTRLVRGSVLELPFRTETIDAIILLEVIEHIEADTRLMEELARILRPGGWLIASVPSTHYFDEYRALIGHYRHYTRESFAALLDGAGLQIVRYLDDQHPMQTLHYYPYMALAGADRLLARCGLGAPSLYRRRVPGTDRTVYGMLRGLLQLACRQRTQQELARSARSTFVMARRSTVVTR